MQKQFIRWVAFTILAAASGSVHADLVYVTDFAKNANMQAALQSTYPSGIFSPNNGFGTSFNILSDANGNNYEQFVGPSGQIGSAGSFTVNVGVAGVTDVYTLMNAYFPANGAELATVEFFGSAGADQTFTLINGVDVRDYFHNVFANTINGTTAREAFTVTGVGHAGGGTVFGTFVLDEQHFALDPAFAGQTLDKIVYTFAGSNGTPILAGVTVQTAGATVPEPASMTLLGLGLCSVVAMGYRRHKVQH